MTPLIIEADSFAAVDDYLTRQQLKNYLVQDIDSDKTIGIDEIRNFLHFATYRPDGQAIFLIRHAELITPIAQNTLLKSLEEAKPEELFILVCQSRYQLLETIQSRCQIVTLTRHQAEETGLSLKILKTLTLSAGDCLNLTDEIIKTNPIVTLEQLISYLQKSNRQLPTQKRLQVLTSALICYQDLKTNINSKLALDHFLLKSQRLIKMKPVHS